MTSKLTSDISEIVVRDLGALAQEIKDTPLEHLWEVREGVSNSVGTLALHLCGNLRHFIGHGLGQDDYERDPQAEFGRRDASKEEILQEIERTQAATLAALTGLSEKDVESAMPITPPRHEGRSIGFFLVQLCCHLSWHRGQLNYLRRILDAGALG
jgi:uncharacterized damage-inducible protein DinB